MSAKIKKAHPGAKVELIKGNKGTYIVTADGRELWNKREMGDEFPNEEQLVAGIKEAG